MRNVQVGLFFYNEENPRIKLNYSNFFIKASKKNHSTCKLKRRLVCMFSERTN